MRVVTLCLGALTVVLSGCGGGGSSDPKPAVNEAPKLGAIADQSIVANQIEQAVGITVTDEAPESVTIQIVSDNPALLSEDAQSMSGSGGQRLALLTPTLDASGAAVVTITATDAAGLTDSIEFALTVTPEQKSMHLFARTELQRSPDDDPELINAVEFMQDADEDDFADLFEE